LFEHHHFPGIIGIETEEPMVAGQISSMTDLTIYTETGVYALEFHYMNLAQPGLQGGGFYRPQ
jgi:hypothetical protein